MAAVLEGVAKNSRHWLLRLPWRRATLAAVRGMEIMAGDNRDNLIDGKETAL